MVKHKEIVITIITIGIFITSVGIFLTTYSRVRKKISSNKNIPSYVEEKQKVNPYAEELMEQIENDNSLTKEDKANAKVYVFHLGTQHSIKKTDLMNGMKPRISNDNIIENDMKLLIANLNMEISDTEMLENNELAPCFILGILYPYEYNSDKDINSFNNMYPAIAECLYDFRYAEVKDDYIFSRKLISKEEYSRLKEYFTDVEELKLYDTLWEKEPPKDDPDYGLYKNYSDVAKPYLKKDYRVAYEFGDGFGFTERFYELDNINKVSDNKYSVQISLYYHNSDPKISCVYCKKIGKFNAEVVNKHIKFGKLVFE